MVNYPNERDCEHGRQRGKCDSCELIRAEQRITELEAQVEERGEQNAKLFKLARKTLWIAHCWNDHNFGHPQDEVKEMVNAMGFDTLDKANKFLTECEPKEQGHD